MGAFCFSTISIRAQQVVIYQQNFDGNNGTFTNTFVSQITATNGWLANNTDAQIANTTYRHLWNFSDIGSGNFRPISGRSLGFGFFQNSTPSPFYTDSPFRTWNSTADCSSMPNTVRWVSIGVSTVGYKDIQIEFKWRCSGEIDGGIVYDYGTVNTSIDGGSTWAMDQTGGSGGTTSAHGTFTGGLYYNNPNVQTQIINLPSSRDNKPNFRLAFRMVLDECFGTGGGFIVDDIIIRGTPISSCVAGTASGPLFIFPLNPASLSLTGSVGSIQWQSSPDGNTNWTNVSGGSGANTANYTTPNLPAGTYYYRAIVGDSSCSDTSNTVTILSSPTPIYCSGVGSGNAFSNNHLENITFHEWSDPYPGNYANNYLDYTDTSTYGYATVVAGQYHHLSALIRANGTGTNGTTFAYWIDWNKDGIFSNTLFSSGGERMDNAFYTSAVGNTYASYFTVPPTASGFTRVRMRVVRGNIGNLDPCNAYTNSQTKDFIVKILPAIAPQTCGTVNGSGDVILPNPTFDKVYISRVHVTGPNGTVMDNNEVFFGVQAGATITMYNYSNFMGSFSNGLVMEEGSPYTVSIEHSGYTTAAGLFIDYNGDGDFNDANELVGRISDPNANPFVFNFNIPPVDVDGKQVAMRVRLRYDDLGNLGNVINACNNINDGLAMYSEVEDYRVTLKKSITTPLPVELIDFSANCSDGHISLHWATATEQNNDYFIIERSNDLINWQLVSRVDGNGNSNLILHYSINDSNPADGLSYYRLKQVDYDGTTEFFGPISIDCEKLDEPTIKLYPNPTDGKFTIAINANNMDDVRIDVLDMTGKLVIQEKKHLIKGHNELLLDASDISSGQYVIHLKSSTVNYKPLKLLIKK